MGDGARDFPAAALPLLRCPVCGRSFSQDERSLRCVNGHSFDVARHGYVNLLPGGARAGTADTAGMVAARESFIGAGHFSGVRTFVCEQAVRAAGGGLGGNRAGEGHLPECAIEVGAGTGYYLAGVLDRLPGMVGLALDISKFAARRAARAHERMATVVCDAWTDLPVIDGCASLVLDVFAPRNPREFRRVLRPEGSLLVVTPAAEHLHELVGMLGLLRVDEDKSERLESSLEARFRLVHRTEYKELLSLRREEVGALAAMGPSAHHLRGANIAERLRAVGDPIQATVSVVASTYMPFGT